MSNTKKENLSKNDDKSFKTFKYNYIKSLILEEMANGNNVGIKNIKQNVKKKIITEIAKLPQEIFKELYKSHTTSPSLNFSEEARKLLNDLLQEEILKGKKVDVKKINQERLDIENNNISTGESYVQEISRNNNIDKSFADSGELYEKFMNIIKNKDKGFSEEFIASISDIVNDMLKTREMGIMIYKKYKNAPEIILCVALMFLNKEGSHGISISDCEGYISNGLAKVGIDFLYGSIHIYLNTNIYEKISPGSGGMMIKSVSFGNMFGIEEKKGVKTNLIFVRDGFSNEDVMEHETQHVANSYFKHMVEEDHDFYEYGKDEILAYISTGTDKEELKETLHSDLYDFLKDREQIIKKWGKVEINIFDFIVTEVLLSKLIELGKNKRRKRKLLKEFETQDVPKRKEYKANIDKYIDIAYKLKENEVKFYINILLITPLHKRPELLNLFKISE